MDMKWHANAHVQHSAKEEADQFWWGKHIDLKINKSINANIKLRKLQFNLKRTIWFSFISTDYLLSGSISHSIVYLNWLNMKQFLPKPVTTIRVGM